MNIQVSCTAEFLNKFSSIVVVSIPPLGRVPIEVSSYNGSDVNRVLKIGQLTIIFWRIIDVKKIILPLSIPNCDFLDICGVCYGNRSDITSYIISYICDYT